MIRAIFLILAFMVFVASLVLTGVAFSQDRNPFWQEPIKSWLRIETEEEQKVLFCGEVVAREGANIRSQPKFEDNIIGHLNKGDIARVYEVAEGDIYIFNRSVRGWTNNIWYKIGEEEFIYSSLVQEEMDQARCLN